MAESCGVDQMYRHVSSHLTYTVFGAFYLHAETLENTPVLRNNRLNARMDEVSHASTARQTQKWSDPQ